MKKTAYLLVVAVLLCAAPAFAQGPFNDVPTDHWAYDAVNKLQKDGIVIGYPDGTFGGKRAMSRYEFAVAIARIEQQIIPDDDDPFDPGSDPETDPETPPVTSGTWYRPPVATTWQWQLQGDVNIGYDVALYELDLFEARLEVREAGHSGTCSRKASPPKSPSSS